MMLSDIFHHLNSAESLDSAVLFITQILLKLPTKICVEVANQVKEKTMCTAYTSIPYLNKRKYFRIIYLK